VSWGSTFRILAARLLIYQKENYARETMQLFTIGDKTEIWLKYNDIFVRSGLGNFFRVLREAHGETPYAFSQLVF